MKKFLFLLFLPFLLTACDSSRVYETYYDLPTQKWQADSVVSFSFEVPDISRPYHLYYNIRHTTAYPYYNLYVEYTLDENDSTAKWIRKDTNLMNPETGVPLGNGTSNFYDIGFPAYWQHKFAKAGKQTFRIRQFMRMASLPEISSVGIRLEYADER